MRGGYHAAGVKLNSRGQRPRIERPTRAPTLKGSNINPTLTGSMNYLDDFPVALPPAIESVPYGDDTFRHAEGAQDNSPGQRPGYELVF